MTTIREMAKAYESPETKNISELDSVNVNLELEEKQFTDSNGKEFCVQVTTIKGVEYRVPNSVLKDLREIIKENPNMILFKVRKTGEGMKTRYTVMSAD